MKKNKLLKLLFLIAISITAKGQEFSIVVLPGDSARNAGNLSTALQLYKKTFDKDPKDYVNVYNYTCALSIEKQIDSAFKYLKYTIQLDPDIHVLSESDFLNLMETDKWKGMEDTILQMYCSKNKVQLARPDITKRLLRLKAKDQAYYTDINIAEEKVGHFSTVVYSLWKFKERLNNENLIELKRIISETGWPEISKVGEQAALSAFLVIQHSNLKEQQEYLPVIRSKCEIKEADWQSYALMYDRVQVGLNKPQKYGSQFYFDEKKNDIVPYPIEDEQNVDKNRKEVGLGTLQDYQDFLRNRYKVLGKIGQ